MEVKSELQTWCLSSSFLSFRRMCNILGNAVRNMKGDAIVTIDFPNESFFYDYTVQYSSHCSPVAI